MKVNFYLDHPQHSYYEIMLNPDKDSPHNIIVSIIQKLYPLHLHSYSTLDPAFIHVQTGTVLDPHKPFSKNGIPRNQARKTFSHTSQQPSRQGYHSHHSSTAQGAN